MVLSSDEEEAAVAALGVYDDGVSLLDIRAAVPLQRMLLGSITPGSLIAQGDEVACAVVRLFDAAETTLRLMRDVVARVVWERLDADPTEASLAAYIRPEVVHRVLGRRVGPWLFEHPAPRPAGDTDDPADVEGLPWRLAELAATDDFYAVVRFAIRDERVADRTWFPVADQQAAVQIGRGDVVRFPSGHESLFSVGFVLGLDAINGYRVPPPLLVLGAAAAAVAAGRPVEVFGQRAVRLVRGAAFPLVPWRLRVEVAAALTDGCWPTAVQILETLSGPHLTWSEATEAWGVCVDRARRVRGRFLEADLAWDALAAQPASLRGAAEFR